MTDNDYVGMKFPDEIAAHECGHVVALAAAGLADEFISATIVPQNGVLGLTVRSGESLIKLSGVLSEYSRKLADSRQESLDRNFVLKIPDVCLPHICFFFGGGSIDRLLGRENPNRNAIDANCIRQKVLPAMFLPSLSDEDLTWVQTKVDEFLFYVFNREKVLFGRIYRAIIEHKTLDRNSIDPHVMKEMQSCAGRSVEEYKSLLVSVKEWYIKREAIHKLVFCKHCGMRVGTSADEAKSFNGLPPEPQEPEFMSAEEVFNVNNNSETDGLEPEEEFYNDENEDEADIEDGELDDSKGLDPNRSYHMRICGRSAELYNDWGQFIRRFNMRTNVIQATTSGELVTICTDDGYTHIYKWDGTFMRRFH